MSYNKMTSFETETTMLLYLVESKTNKEIRLTLPLPSRIFTVFDFTRNIGQLSLFFKENPDFSALEGGDYYVCMAVITNDPYCDNTAFVINLGYYSFRFRFCHGRLISLNPFTYITNTLRDGLIMNAEGMRYPLTFGDPHTVIPYIESCEFFQQMADFRFGDSTEDPLTVLRSKLAYNVGNDGKYYYTKGDCETLICDMRSSWAHSEVINKKDIESLEEMFKYHGISKN